MYLINIEDCNLVVVYVHGNYFSHKISSRMFHIFFAEKKEITFNDIKLQLPVWKNVNRAFTIVNQNFPQLKVDVFDINMILT
jgi:hypothetical protein